MTKCPVCKVNAWNDGTFGYQECPNCRSGFLLGKGEIHRAKKQRFIQAPRTNASAEGSKARDAIIVNGLVLCCACRRACNPPESTGNDCAIRGRVDFDAKQTVFVADGWTTTDGETFQAHYKPRTIPKSLSGLFCPDCALRLGARPTGEPKAPNKRERLSMPGLDGPRERDPEPNWAHSGDSSWIATSGKSYHSAECGCPTCEQKAVGLLSAQRLLLACLGYRLKALWQGERRKVWRALPDSVGKRLASPVTSIERCNACGYGYHNTRSTCPTCGLPAKAQHFPTRIPQL